MPCVPYIALCGQLETIYWEAAGAIIPENNEWCRSRNNGERIRTASQCCLAACMHRIVRTWKEECSQSDEYLGCLGVSPAGAWGQNGQGTCHRGKGTNALPAAATGRSIQLPSTCCFSLQSRKPTVKIPVSSASYQLIFSWRAKQLPLCMCVMASLLKKWFIIYQQVLWKWRACTFILHDSLKMVVNLQSVKGVIMILCIESNLRKLIQGGMRWWKGEELGCCSWPAVVSQGQGWVPHHPIAPGANDVLPKKTSSCIFFVSQNKHKSYFPPNFLSLSDD